MCRHQRRVVKIDVQAVVRAGQDLHLENDSRRQSKKLLLQAFKAFGACRGRQLIALKAPASHNGRFCKVFTLQAMLLHFIKQEIQPGGSMLQRSPDGLNDLAVVLRNIFHFDMAASSSLFDCHRLAIRY